LTVLQLKAGTSSSTEIRAIWQPFILIKSNKYATWITGEKCKSVTIWNCETKSEKNVKFDIKHRKALSRKKRIFRGARKKSLKNSTPDVEISYTLASAICVLA
jgi:hypothetical protein